MKETDIYEQIAQYVNLQYRHIRPRPHFDLSGLWTPSHQARNMYGRLNMRAWPDFFWPVLRTMAGSTNVYFGLFIEVKRDGTRLKKRDGDWASTHIAEQAQVLDDLAEAGYLATFACGFDEAQRVIDSYMNDGIAPPEPRSATSIVDVWPPANSGEIF